MAAKRIWDGRGDAEGCAYWTKDDGVVVGRPYVRRRASSWLSERRSAYSLDDRQSAIRETIESDEWMAGRAGMTVGAIAREVEDHLVWNYSAMPVVRPRG